MGLSALPFPGAYNVEKTVLFSTETGFIELALVKTSPRQIFPQKKLVMLKELFGVLMMPTLIPVPV